MIRALRRRHWGWSLVLGVTLPALYLALALGRRPTEPTGPLADADSLHRQVVGMPLVLLERPRITGELLAAPDQTPTALRVIPAADPAIPDLLAYWAPAPGDGAALPPDAFLLGNLRGSRTQIIPVPEPGMMSGGHLLLYSMGWHRVVSTIPLPAAP